MKDLESGLQQEQQKLQHHAEPSPQTQYFCARESGTWRGYGMFSHSIFDHSRSTAQNKVYTMKELNADG